MQKGKMLFSKVMSKSILPVLIIILFIQGCSGEKLQNGSKSSHDAENTRDISQNTEEISQPRTDEDNPSISDKAPGDSEGKNGDTQGNSNDGTGALHGGEQGSSGSSPNNSSGSTPNNSSGSTPNNSSGGSLSNIPIDLNKIKPDETGRIMVVMFHNFIEEYKKGDKEFTITFDAFGKLLEKLYTMDYRLISLNDYLKGNIKTQAGKIPMIFTFDDGTAGQFNLIEDGGNLKANPRSAVGILEEFYKTHPDFGIGGTFYVNLGNQTFGGAGTLEQRLEYLKDKGFEIGNHTYTHVNLKEIRTADKLQKEIGENQKKMYELIPGYILNTFSLPYGAPSKELQKHVIKGEYEGVEYENIAIMKVGSDPAPSPFSVNFDPLSTQRVRSPGIEPVLQDLSWWLENYKRGRQYISDGNPDTVTVPEDKAEFVDKTRLGSRELIIYEPEAQ